MTASVPLWAFVSLGLAAPIVALVGVLITTGTESRRSHRMWLYQTKYESYERLFTTYFDLSSAYSDYLAAARVTPWELQRLTETARAFKNQYEKTALVASLRVSVYMEREMIRLWVDAHLQIDAAVVGKRAPRPSMEWGDYVETRDAVRFDLRVRRDPGGWRARWRDRDFVVRRRIGSKQPDSVLTFDIANPYEQPPVKKPDQPLDDAAGKAPTAPD